MHGTRFWEVKITAPIVVQGGSIVPCVNSMWAPRCSEGRWIEDNDMHSRQCKGVCIPVIFVTM